MCQTGKKESIVKAYCRNFRGYKPGTSLPTGASSTPTIFSLRWTRAWISGTTENVCSGTWLWKILDMFSFVGHLFTGGNVRTGMM